MIIRYGLAIAATWAGCLWSVSAHAGCEPGDFICSKFSFEQTTTKAARQTTKRVRHRARKPVAKPAPTTVTAQPPAPVVIAAPTSADIATSSVSSAPRPATIKSLAPGAITTAPATLTSLAFQTSERTELASATCGPVAKSERRISCAIAVHQLAQTGSDNLGCSASLALRQLEFARNEEGAWVNEDSIALCGGRLLRRTELYPVAVNDTNRYALREEYQLIGGDKTCAKPYLVGRQPLNKSYTPLGADGAIAELACGRVASR